MHPQKITLEQYVDGHLDKKKYDEIDHHVADCDFCQEYCNQYKSLSDEINRVKGHDLNQTASEITSDIMERLNRKNIIPLFSITAPEAQSTKLMAADGQATESNYLHTLITLGSESPEVVLKLMRNPKTGCDFIQLIGDNKEQITNVLVQLPDIDKEFLTDSNGLAQIDQQFESYENLKWQIKLPSAVFELQKVEFDSEKAESVSRTILISDADDKLEVILEKKSEGAQLNIRILEVAGKKVDGEIRAVVAQKDMYDTKFLKPEQASVFDLTDSEASIKIRLFIQ